MAKTDAKGQTEEREAGKAKEKEEGGITRRGGSWGRGDTKSESESAAVDILQCFLQLVVIPAMVTR